MRFFSCCCVDKDDPKAELLLDPKTEMLSATMLAQIKSSFEQDSASSTRDNVSSLIVRPSLRDLVEEKRGLGDKESYSVNVERHSASLAVKESRAKSEGTKLKKPKEKSLSEAQTLRYIWPGKVESTLMSPETKLGARHFGSLALPLAERSMTAGSTTSVSTYAPYLMTQIHEHLYLGNIDDALNEEELKAKGITHILSVTQGKSRVSFVKHEQIVMNDRGDTDLERVLEKAIPFIEEGQEDGNTILVHCKVGQNRSATVLIAYLMKRHGKNLYEAHKEVKTKRPLVQINRGYAQKLLELEKEIYGKNSLPEDWMVQEPVNMKTYEVKFRWASVTSTVHRQLEENGQL